MPGPSRLPVRLPATALSLAALLALPLSAAPAAAEPDDALRAYETRVTAAEYYADLFADEPEGAGVVVDGAVAGLHDPDALEADLRAAFDTLGEPYHVLVSPFPGIGTEWGGALLPALHDRVGADGIYVHLRPGDSFPEAAAYGVDLPVDEARNAVASDPAIDYDAPVDRVADRFVAALAGAGTSAQGPAPYAEPTAWDGFAEGWQSFLDDLDPTSHNGPGNAGFLAGTLGGAVLGAGGLLVWRILRRSGPGGGRIALVTGTVAVTLAAAGAVSLGPLALVVRAPEGGVEIPDPREEAYASPPYVVSADRTERIARELRDAPAPLYVDPRTPVSLEGLAGTAARLADAPVPVRALVLPLDATDEFSGDPEVLAHAVGSVSGEDAVYLVVTQQYPAEEVRVLAASVGLAEVNTYELWNATSEIQEPTAARALDAALDALDGLEYGDGAYTSDPFFMDSGIDPPGPRVPRYFAEGFPAGLLFLGPLAVLSLAGAVALVRTLSGSTRGGPRPVGARSLRRTALRESNRLRAVLASDRAARVPDELMPQAEAVLLAMDHDPDDLDRVGAVVVSRRVLAALADPSAGPGRPPCRVNPLHPPSVLTRRSKAVGGNAPLCADCAGRSEAERAARVLRVRDRLGGELRYLSMDDRAWVRHHFGATRPARMAERLLEEIDAR